MSVYKPKKSPFYHYDFQLGGVRYSGSTERTSKIDARKVEAQHRVEARIEAERSKADDDGPMTLVAATHRYWREVGIHHANFKTTAADIKRIAAYFGPTKRLCDIRDDDIAKLVAWRRAQKAWGRSKAKLIAPATVNRSTIEPLQKIFNRAIDTWGLALPKAPRWKRHLLDEPEERVREVRAGEEASLAAIRDDFRPLVDFARESGLRMAECLLRKDQVDLLGAVVRTRGKGGKAIAQPITTAMRAILMAEMANPTEHVFTYAARRPWLDAAGRRRAKGERRPITISGLKSLWRRAKPNRKHKHPAAGPRLPPDLRFHDLRHDFATKLLRETRNLRLVQKALHHSKVETTTKYAHVMEDEVAAGMEAASRARHERQRVPDKIPNQDHKVA